MALRILILERHALFGEAIRSALIDAKMDVLEVIPTGRDAIAFLESDEPDVLLIGLDLADSRANLMKRRPRKSDGLAIGRRILTRWPDANMILMSEWDDPQVIDGALKIGFRGYLSRAAPFPEFLKAIQAIVDGETVFPKPFADEADQYPRMTERLSTLTHQEREILGFLVEGSDSRTIARRLGILEQRGWGSKRSFGNWIRDNGSKSDLGNSEGLVVRSTDEVLQRLHVAIQVQWGERDRPSLLGCRPSCLQTWSRRSTGSSLLK